MEQPRLAINELSSLVRRNNQAAINDLAGQFPEFAEELTKGVTLGKQEDKAYIEQKAKLALGLCDRVIELATARIGALQERARTQRLRKMVLLALGGISGAATLGAVGFSPGAAARIGAIVTSLVSIGTAIHEYLLRDAEHNIEASIAKLTRAKYSLTVLAQDLQAALDAGIDAKRVEWLISKANSVAEELGAEAEQLGV